jgi:nicotinate-nucleotide adenylyltransferase
VTTGIFGGAFDPPHLGHVALAREAKRRFGLDRLVVLVAALPEHKEVSTPVEDRLALAQAAFPGDDVRIDEHPRTVDMLRAENFDDALLLVGADQLASFQRWKEPAAVLDMARVAVATRPGLGLDELSRAIEQLGRPDRIELFPIEPKPIASRDLRARAARGESLDELVPPAVAQEIERRGLYRDPSE